MMLGTGLMAMVIAQSAHALPSTATGDPPGSVAASTFRTADSVKGYGRTGIASGIGAGRGAAGLMQAGRRPSDARLNGNTAGQIGRSAVQTRCGSRAGHRQKLMPKNSRSGGPPMEAHGFDVDLVLEPRLSARRAWIVASAAGGLSLILATALVLVLPCGKPKSSPSSSIARPVTPKTSCKSPRPGSRIRKR